MKLSCSLQRDKLHKESNAYIFSSGSLKVSLDLFLLDFYVVILNRQLGLFKGLLKGHK